MISVSLIRASLAHCSLVASLRTLHRGLTLGKHSITIVFSKLQITQAQSQLIGRVPRSIHRRSTPCILWRWIAILGKLFPPLFHPSLPHLLARSSVHENALSAPKLHHWLHCNSGSFRPPVDASLLPPSLPQSRPPSLSLSLSLSLLSELSLEQLPGRPAESEKEEEGEKRERRRIAKH